MPACSAPDRAVVEALRARIAALDGGAALARRPLIRLGVAAIDEALPWRGLPRSGLHEVIADDDSGAAIAFSARLLALAGAADGSGTVVWCRRTTELYGPGLAALGLDPARLLLVLTATARDVCWAMEEALRCRSVAAVLGETGNAGGVALRRLQLAAETTGAMAILFRRNATITGGGSAISRWRVTAAGGGERRFPATRWRLVLDRVRGGAAGQWLVEVADATGDLRLAADLRHRSGVRPAASIARAG